MTIDPDAPVPPAITALKVSAVSATAAVLVWSTERPAVSFVDYGQTIAYGGSTALATAADTTHATVLNGLQPLTPYQIRVTAIDPENGTSSSVGDSLVTEPEPDPGPGIWIGRAELMRRPTSGPEWNAVLADAAREPGTANIADQDSNHDVYTLAASLVCVRTGKYCAKARQGVLDAIGTEDDGRWLAVGRNLGAYVIAADLLNLREDGVDLSDGTRVGRWLARWPTKRLADNNTGEPRRFAPFGSGANAAAQEGFAYTAVAAYLRDASALQRAWDALRTYLCDPSGPDHEGIYLVPAVLDGWAHSDARPCAVNPAGTVKLVPLGLLGGGLLQRIDGALVGDMRRGGPYQWEPGYTSYPWVGLEGVVPAAVILHRSGYPAFEVADRAVLRTHEYLRFLLAATGDERWFDGVRAREIVHLVNRAYGTTFPVMRPIGAGRTVGYTDWSHPVW